MGKKQPIKNMSFYEEEDVVNIRKSLNSDEETEYLLRNQNIEEKEETEFKNEEKIDITKTEEEIIDPSEPIEESNEPPRNKKQLFFQYFILIFAPVVSIPFFFDILQPGNPDVFFIFIF
jgi:hypothetical protein